MILKAKDLLASMKKKNEREHTQNNNQMSKILNTRLEETKTEGNVYANRSLVQ